MAKYQITHTCGCTKTHNIVGTNVNGERSAKADWLQSKPCLDCARRDKANAAAAATADLPPLTGSDKQIAWATTIRAGKVSSLRECLAKVQAVDTDNARKLAAWITSVIEQGKAAYWIDHRDESYDRHWIMANYPQ